MLDGFIGKFKLAMREARLIRVSLLLAAGLNLLAWGLFAWFAAMRSGNSPFFALHYTIYFGVDSVGAPWRVAATPLLGTVILATNAFLAAESYTRDRMVGAFLTCATVLFEALLCFSLFLTILLNV